jgi:hypothetical protein
MACAPISLDDLCRPGAERNPLDECETPLSEPVDRSLPAQFHSLWL